MDILTSSIGKIQPGQVMGQSKAKDGDINTDFGDFFKNAINDVNSLQQQAAEMKTKLVTGDVKDIHEVMIAAEKANIAFQLTVQIRNKVVEAYQEILRMQV